MIRFNNNDCQLRETPLTDIELARFHRLLANPQPGNPKWYKVPIVAPFKFRPGAAPAVPRQARCTVMTVPPHEQLRCIGGPFDGDLLEVCIENDVRTLPMAYQGRIGRYEGAKPGGTAAYTEPLRWVILKECTTMSESKNEGTTILWTRPMLVKFKRAYAHAVETHQAVFKFEEHDFVIGYAKYLIEFLEGKFK